MLKYLPSTDQSFGAIWAWAKQLVTDLNKKLTSVEGVVQTGTMTAWAGATAPQGWLLCDGSQYTKSAQPALFMAIGYVYGGAGDVFNVPDCRDRALFGAGSLVALGGTAGSNKATLSIDNMPAHAHAVTDLGHTHAFTGDPHNHTVTDPGHSHGVTDTGHAHAGGAAVAANVGTAGAAADVVAQANTASSTTGVTVNAASTGVSVNNTASTGSNATSLTGVEVDATGGGVEFSILNPVIGINMIIKA